MTEAETKAQKWDYARVAEKFGINQLGKLNTASRQVAHAQADGALVAFCRKAGFKDIADKYENVSEEFGFSYKEQS